MPILRWCAVTAHRAAAGRGLEGRMWPQALVRYVELFNAGRYWHAHEVLEEAWRTHTSPFYQGLIVYAAAFVHGQRGNPRGVVLHLGKLPRFLGSYPDRYLGLDVASILQDARQQRDTVLKAGMPEGERLWRLLRWPVLELDPARCSGRETELSAGASPGP